MSKIIKHRLINVNHKIVGYEKWYEGAFDEETQTYKAHPCWLYSVDNQHWTPNKIEHRYKNVFTGLLDKNGLEVYEGDIISKKAYNGEEYLLTGVVEYSQEGFCLKCIKSNKVSFIGQHYAFSLQGEENKLHKGEIVGNMLRT